MRRTRHVPLQERHGVRETRPAPRFNCVDGVCCNVACAGAGTGVGTCYSCMQAGSVGTCTEARCKFKDGEPCASNADCLSGSCITSYRDGDGDGYGPARSRAASCAPAAGYVLTGGDCCDSDPGTHPGVTSYAAVADACGGFDRNCDGKVERRTAARWPAAASGPSGKLGGGQSARVPVRLRTMETNRTGGRNMIVFGDRATFGRGAGWPRPGWRADARRLPCPRAAQISMPVMRSLRTSRALATRVGAARAAPGRSLVWAAAPSGRGRRCGATIVSSSGGSTGGASQAADGGLPEDGGSKCLRRTRPVQSPSSAPAASASTVSAATQPATAPARAARRRAGSDSARRSRMRPMTPARAARPATRRGPAARSLASELLRDTQCASGNCVDGVCCATAGVRDVPGVHGRGLWKGSARRCPVRQTTATATARTPATVRASATARMARRAPRRLTACR